MPDLLKQLPAWLTGLIDPLNAITEEIYLVGGAIRNLIIGLNVDDYDFVVDKNAIQCARRAADLLGGKFFILDHDRKTARALIPVQDAEIKLDFAQFNGENISEDLKARDFTINAIAAPFLAESSLIDPLGGVADLQEKQLNPCQPSSFDDDPVRIIRYVRFLEQLEYQGSTETERLARSAAKNLDKISGERQRDGLMDVINVSNLKRAFNHLQDIGVASEIFSEVEQLSKVALTSPHIYNGWDHTMQVMHYCQQFMMSFSLALQLPELHTRIKEALVRLNQFKEPIQTYFQTPVSWGRSKYQLLILSALFHDSAKAVVTYEFSGERKKFPGHAKTGSRIVEDWAKTKGFSRLEIKILSRVVRMHMKVSKPQLIENGHTRLAVHRFFKRNGVAGVLTAILHLADVLTTYEDKLTDSRWDNALTAVENIFDGYFFNYDEIIAPHLLLNGREVMRALNIPPGEKVGYLLNKLEEAQVTGEVVDQDQAIKFLQSFVSK